MYKEFKYPNLETYIDDLKSIIKETENKINGLLNIENKTYKNFVIEYDLTFEKLSQFTFPLSHINSVKNTDETQEVYSESLPILSEFYTNLGQREDIYSAFKEVEKTELNEAESRVIEETLLSFKLQGIGMKDENKNRIKEINSELSDLSNQFSNNLLNATKEYKLTIEDCNDVSEFPESELKRHQKEKEDGTIYWEFNLQGPSFTSYMKYGNNRDLRFELYKAYTTRAPENEDIIEKILNLKEEKAKILGYDNYAEVSLSKKMAKSPDEVMEFLASLSTKAIKFAENDKEELQKFAETKGFDGVLKPWDNSYYINKYKEDNFDYKEEELKPYFEQSSVINGMFNFLNTLFDLEFEEVDSNTWDPKVKIYNIKRNGKHHSRLYLDLESRDDKRGGAWMNNSQTGYTKDGNKVLPIAYICCNFTPSSDDIPSLLTHSEVNTLFHEMGHVLQHICSEIEDPTYSGINGIEWDAVEWSSQFLELFVYESDVLKNFAKHYESGETLPQEWIDKINKLKNWREGSAMVRQLNFGLFDMIIHKENGMTKEKVQQTLDVVRDQLGIEVPEFNKFQCGFSHIFSGGYSAGYYSYKWAEVLSVDSFLEFKSRGIYNKENSENYYNEFLSKGSSLPSGKMFKNYMGRKPDTDSLVKYYLNDK